MKLVYIFDSRIIAAKTGSLIHVVELLKALENKGLDLTILTSYEAKEVEMKGLVDMINTQSSAREDQPVKKYSVLLPLKIKQQISKLRKTKNCIKIFWHDRKASKFYLSKLLYLMPDAIYQRHNVFTASALMVAKRLKIPVILEVNAPVFYEEDLYLRFLFKRNELNVFNLADAIIVVSNNVKDILIKVGVREEKIYVIPNAVDAVTFSPQVSGDYIRTKYGLHNKIVVGFVGSYKPWHGIDSILNCILRIHKSQRENLHFLLIGEGPLKEYALRFLINNDLFRYVSLIGKIGHNEVPQYLAASDILIAPHDPIQKNKMEFHGSPIKLFEYMAMAKPIIASMVGQIDEILQDGDNAILINPGDEEGLLNAILLLSKDRNLRDRLGKRARETILYNHTWEKNAIKVVDIIKRLQCRWHKER